MQILGLNITRTKALNTIGTTLHHGWRRILESFSGAWQMNVEERRGELITYPTLYACIYRISSDIGKLPYRLRRRMDTGVWQEATSPAYDPVLRKPNGFQTAGQFREYWMVTKLTNGNTYVLKRRDDRGVVIELYVLDPERVLPMVSDAGFVYYQLQIDPLNTLPKGYPAEGLIVPASEVIHDRCMTIHHPLIGIPPLAAAHWPALKNMKILRSATEFFGNNAQPGGILTAPAGMSDEDAEAVKSYWATNFTGTNAGRVAIVGADMKFTPFAMKSIDAQMVEQMRYSDEQICQPFGIPPFMVGIGSIPAGLGVDGVYQLYYQNALQTHIEHKEALLDEGLRVAAPLGIELDLEPLLRMDEGKRADVATKLIKGVGSTNELRAKYFNWGPLVGGDTVYMQQQDFPLDQVRLNKITQPVEPAPAEVSEEDQAAIEEAKAIIATQKAITAMRRAAQPEGANV
jgi:HK97 family phage portal protein